MLHLEKDVTAPKTLFPQQSHFISHSDDFSEKKFIAPIYRYIINKIDTFELLSRTDIRFYITFMLIMAIIYGGIAIVWPH